MNKRDKNKPRDKGEKRAAGIKKLKYIAFLAKPYFKYGGKSAVTLLAASAVLQPASSVLAISASKKTIDAVVRRDSPKKILKSVAPIMLGSAALNIAHSLIQNMTNSTTQVKVSIKATQEVNEKALRTDLRHYDNPEFYDSYMFTQQNYPNYLSNMTYNLQSLTSGIVNAAVTGVAITAVNPPLMLLELAAVAAQIIISSSSTMNNADLSQRLNTIYRPIQYITRALQTKENSSEMRTSGAGEKLLRNYDRAIVSYYDFIRGINRSGVKESTARMLVYPAKTVLELLYITKFVIRGDSSKVGLYASLTESASRLSMYLQGIYNQIMQFYGQAVYGERIAKFFETESIIEPPRLDAAPPPEGIYDVELRDISFRYENAAFGLEHFNLKIPAGQRVAIVGENGAGKSTLTKLLLRLYDVDSGTVLINGRDIRDYDVHALRRRIGIAYQDVRILAMSLRDNLTVYNDVGDDELREVIAKLGLESVLEKVGGDLDTMVSREFTEDGAVLSGGEAQRLSLARLFTGPFGLLLLDEPSSSLDPLAEHKLMQTILDKSNTATTVMIAHRLSTVRSFDVIYHIEDGKIIETGTHDDLMALRGKYYEMFTRQAENYQDEMAMTE